jgi:hypothetical protein
VQPQLEEPVVAAAIEPASVPFDAAASQPSSAASDAAMQSPSASAATASTSPPAPDVPTSVAASAERASAPASGAAANFEWPSSTRMSYELNGYYRGDVKGSAQVEWIRDGSHYQVHVDLVVGPSMAPIVTRLSSSDGEITADGLKPRRYDEETKVLMGARTRRSVIFEPNGVTLANGERRDNIRGLQDGASQFVQLSYVFSTQPSLLHVGGSVNMPLALPRKVDVWVYDVVDQEPVTTPFGTLMGVHLKPRRTDDKAGSITAEIWFAPQLRYLPVRIRFDQDGESYLDLTISKPPEIAN